MNERIGGIQEHGYLLPILRQQNEADEHLDELRIFSAVGNV